MTINYALRAVAVMSMVLATQPGLLAWCLWVQPPIDSRRTENWYRYNIDSSFTDDGAQFGYPGFSSRPCIEAGLKIWDGRGGVSVTLPPPSVNVEVQPYTPSGAYGSPPGNVFAGSTNKALGRIRISWDIARASGFNCTRIKKLAGHEMGHMLGLGHLSNWQNGSIMNEWQNGGGPLGGIDQLNDFITCGEEIAVVNSWWFLGPPPSQWGDIGGPLQCGVDEVSDMTGCCHPLELAFAPAVNQYNNKPLSHILSPANNSNFGPWSTIPFNLHTMDVDGSVYRVDWFSNGSPVATSYSFPFTLNASNVPPGTYVIEAAAYDTAQQYTLSAPVTVYVLPPPSGPSVLVSGAVLYPNEVRTNGAYYVRYEAVNGNFVLYGPQGGILGTGTGLPAGGVYMNPNGALEVYNSYQQLLWSSGTASGSNAGSHMRVESYGKLSIVRPNGSIVVQWP